MYTKYDCIIVGAGPMGIFTAFELMLKAPNLNVLVIEQGLDIYSRHCPIQEKKINKCPINAKGESGCYPSCSLTSGFGGSGAYSDGKFNITSEFGGWMGDYLDDSHVLELIKYVDQINLDHGAPSEVVNQYTPEVLEIERRGIAKGLKLLRSEVRHLGTEVNLQVLKNIYEDLKKKVSFLFSTKVVDVVVDNSNKVNGVILEDGSIINSEYVVLGIGRRGSEWLTKTLTKHGITFTSNKVDIGVRVETNDIIMADINKHLYEGKFIFESSVGTIVRTFCSNPSGHVVVENNNGIMICNGHSFSNHLLGSNNTNFALLVSHSFDNPFKDSNEYALEISKLANKLSNGGVIVQKYGDIKKGRRSSKKRIDEGFVKPTLKEAVPGDLGLVLPYNTMKSLIEMVEALDAVTPGIANDHTLFYGVEAKFYSDRPDVSKEFETKITNLFVGGDGAGLTRGLAQAGASGVYVARTIAKRANN